jgi:hypothetical protein
VDSLHGDFELSESIYAPPEADIAVESVDEDAFYVVSPRKFFLLSVLTFDLYFVYWFYRNWRQVKRCTGEKMIPPLRGVFFIFFTHSLFRIVDQKIKSLGKTFAWSPGTLATIVVVLSIVTNINDRLSTRNIGSPLTDFIGIALVPIIPAIMLTAQRAINTACGDVEGAGNNNLTLANWVWMVIGGLLWLLVIAGLYLVVTEPELFLE